MHSFRLISRCRVGPTIFAIRDDEIARAGPNRRGACEVIAIAALQLYALSFGRQELDRNSFAFRRPDHELCFALHRSCPEPHASSCSTTMPRGGNVRTIEC